MHLSRSAVSCCYWELYLALCKMHAFSHPIHPALVHFPIAFWSTASVLDVFTASGITQNRSFAWYCLALGCAMAVPAMVTGWLEYAKLEEHLATRAFSHMVLMCTAWIFYLAAFFSRTHHISPVTDPNFLTYIFSACGFLSLIWGGWRGGELVYRYGAGRMADPH